MIHAAPMLTTTSGPQMRCTQFCFGKQQMRQNVPRATRGASGPFAPTPSVDITTSAVTTSNKQMPRIADIIAMLLHLQAGRPHRKWQPDPHQAATSCFELRRPYACSPKSRRRAVRRQPAQLFTQRLILLR